MTIIAFFSDFLVFAILNTQRVCLKGCLVCNLEDFDFFDLEIVRTRENDILFQSGVVGVTSAKLSVTVGVCVAIVENTDVTTTPEAWTESGNTPDCLVLPFDLQRKSLRRDAVRILQRENKTLLTVIRLKLPPLV
jgi:hypothetical protein